MQWFALHGAGGRKAAFVQLTVQCTDASADELGGGKIAKKSCIQSPNCTGN
jgi:hypothetical protein